MTGLLQRTSYADFNRVMNRFSSEMFLFRLREKQKRGFDMFIDRLSSQHRQQRATNPIGYGIIRFLFAGGSILLAQISDVHANVEQQRREIGVISNSISSMVSIDTTERFVSLSVVDKHQSSADQSRRSSFQS